MSLMKAVERLQKELEKQEAVQIEGLVNSPPSDVGLGHIRYAQGVIAGLRAAHWEIQEMRKRYNEDDDADS